MADLVLYLQNGVISRTQFCDSARNGQAIIIKQIDCCGRIGHASCKINEWASDRYTPPSVAGVGGYDDATVSAECRSR